jgi:DNA (cytosine-5)-methyltransferase 1
MSLGFEQAGFDVVASLEYDRAHAAAHRFNFPRCEVICKDATQVTGDDLVAAAASGLNALARPKERARHVDVVFGGPPCQGFSVGGHLDPDDPRNGLVVEFARLIEEIRPTVFVLENVPAMATRVLPGTGNPVPVWFREQMERSGYETSLGTVLNASWFGVPQDRRRLIIVGALEHVEQPVPPEPRTQGRPKTPGARPRPGEVGHLRSESQLPATATVNDAIGDLPDLDTFDELLISDAVVLDASQRALMTALTSDYAAVLAGVERAEDDYSRPRIYDGELLTSSLRTRHSDSVIHRFSETKQGTSDPVSRLYRLHPEGVSRTLRAGSAPDRGSYSAPRPIHPELNRVISVREAARLSGFPDWFRFTAAKWHGFRQVGNAVCPPFGRAIAASVRDALEYVPSRPVETTQLGEEGLLRVSAGAGRRSRNYIAAGTVGNQR